MSAAEYYDDYDARDLSVEELDAAEGEEAPKRRVGESWRRIDLAAVFTDGYEEPFPSLGVPEGMDFGLLYPGRTHMLFGDSGGGKTWVAMLLAAAELLAGNHVVFVDYEDSAVTAVERLLLLGVSQDVIVDKLIYVNPEESFWLGASVLVEELEGLAPTLAILDSTGEGMVLDGVKNSNDDTEVAGWFRGVARTLSRDVGAAVLLLDHVAKGGPGGRNVDFGIGSQRKRAAITGVSYYLDTVKPLSGEQDGLMKLVTKKCRLKHHTAGRTAAEVVFEHAEDGSLRGLFRAPEPARVEAEGGTFRRTVLMERISDWLEAHDPQREGVSLNKLVKAVTGKEATLANAVDDLVETGHVVEREGPRRARLVTLVTPFDGATADAGYGNDEPF